MTTAYSPQIVTDGLALALDAGNRKSYPGSGTVWNDLSQNRYTATVTNPTFSNFAGGSFSFGGSYATVTIPSTTLSSFTYCVWARPTALGGYQTLIDWPNDSWYFGFLGTQLITYSPTYQSGINLSNNTWYYLCISHTLGSPVYFYVNGELRYASGLDSTTRTSTTISIAHGGGGEQFSGNISQVLVYLRELSLAEIQQNFIATRKRFGL